MDVLYIPQLDEPGAAGDGSVTRYRLLRRTPVDGKVCLTDAAVTRVEVAGSDPLKVVMPPSVKGLARDFFLRLVITSEEMPEIVFAAPSGETVSFEDSEEGVLECAVGVNVFAFTETEDGVFAVSRKQHDIMLTVAFDPCEGVVGETEREFRLGALYGTLPAPVRQGYTFLGWFTEEEGGVAVTSASTCKSTVARLYAHWEVYVDPYCPSVCEAGNLVFTSDGNAVWRRDDAVFASAPASVRSGAVTDSQRSSLYANVVTGGRIAFKWRVSSEENYDKLAFLVDGTEKANISGSVDWQARSFDIPAGTHKLEWRYYKDGSDTQGSDCGWIDDVVWTSVEGA